ncbi:unnamed protein product, partial [Thlaspi arvense]
RPIYSFSFFYLIFRFVFFLYFKDRFMASVGNTLCLVVALLLIYQKTATCREAAAPVQPKTFPQYDDDSPFDVCRWVICGGGSCNKTNVLSYNCHCREGYKNLFHIAMLPCIKNCTIGKDCLDNVIIPFSNASSFSPSPLPESSKNLTDSSNNQAAGLNLRGSSLWLIASLLCVSIAPWNLLYI